MTVNNLYNIFSSITKMIDENKDYLIQLDQQNGDGDLGISMSNGFNSVTKELENITTTDLGKTFMKAAITFNETAPSSLGTILSFGLMGIAKSLKNKEEANINDIAIAMEAGLNNIMEKGKSKPGEKTIIDSLYPAIIAIKENVDKDNVFELAYEAAKEGSQKTKEMKSVHGRAAYYSEKSLGILDGGSVVGQLIFEGILNYSRSNNG